MSPLTISLVQDSPPITRGPENRPGRRRHRLGSTELPPRSPRGSLSRQDQPHIAGCKPDTAATQISRDPDNRWQWLLTRDLTLIKLRRTAVISVTQTFRSSGSSRPARPVHRSSQMYFSARHAPKRHCEVPWWANSRFASSGEWRAVGAAAHESTAARPPKRWPR